MKKLLRNAVLIGVLAGAGIALFSYLRGTESSGEEVVQITFDDGSTRALDARSVEAQEFTDIARKLVEIGL